MNIFVKLQARLRLREAVKMAERAHAQTGNRYYVLPVYGSHGRKLIVIDRQNFRKMRQKHYISGGAKVVDLINECFYHTAYRDGNKGMSLSARRAKRRQYMAWVAADRKR